MRGGEYVLAVAKLARLMRDASNRRGPIWKRAAAERHRDAELDALARLLPLEEYRDLVESARRLASFGGRR